MKWNSILNLILGLSSILVVDTCSSGKRPNVDTFEALKIYEKGVSFDDQKNIAIGNLKSGFSSNYVFVPSEINGYTVRELGCGNGFGGGYGYLYSNKPETEEEPGYSLERFYCPNTINYIRSGYMRNTNDLNVFYCGAILNVLVLLGDNIKIYVPNEKYEEFYKAIDKGFEHRKDDLYRANVSYMLNYETNNPYYYVDNYEYGEIIQYIPPEPKREGYTFLGWYQDPEGIMEWEFKENKLSKLEEEEFKETKLYAKWEMNKK